MESNFKGFWKFIKFLQEGGFLNHVIVIGSWAEHIYQQSGLLNDYKATLRTLDQRKQKKMVSLFTRIV